MAARSFEDSAGANWEVFEVHRASRNPGAVSAGLEQGWLAFVNGAERRRLAPFPADWEKAGVPELERLCSRARIAAAPRLERRRPPSVRPSGADSSHAPGGDGPSLDSEAHQADVDAIAASYAQPSDEEVGASDDSPELAAVEAAVRGYAHEARAAGIAAIEAMLRLKVKLLEQFPGEQHVARNARLVRRWFVDTFYFERDA